MSLNIHISGEKTKEGWSENLFPWQTPTTFTKYVIETTEKNTLNKSNIEKDLYAVDLLEVWVLEEIGPKPLKEKDARNSFLIKEQNDDIEYLKNKLNEIRDFIKKQGGKEQLVGYL